MRLIDADTLIDDIKNRLWDWDSVDGITATTVLKQTIADIENQPTVSGWVSVKDRLPETNDEVLITYVYDNKPRNRFVEAASYFDDGEGEGHWSSAWDEYRIGNARRTVIAWMPMPKPYKPEVNEDA